MIKKDYYHRNTRHKVELLGYDAEKVVYRSKKRNELTPLIVVPIGTFLSEYMEDEKNE